MTCEHGAVMRQPIIPWETTNSWFARKRTWAGYEDGKTRTQAAGEISMVSPELDTTHLAIVKSFACSPVALWCRSRATHRTDDRLEKVSPLLELAPDLRFLLTSAVDEDDLRAMRRQETTARRRRILARLEKNLGRVLRRQEPGRKRRGKYVRCPRNYGCLRNRGIRQFPFL